MEPENKQNGYVHDGNIFLYTHENDIGKMIRSIMEENGCRTLNSKENAKKSIELFHLLTYLDISGYLEKVTKIIPNEPGDFLITIDGKNVLYEIVTVFGNMEAKPITDLAKKILGIKDIPDSVINEYPTMDTQRLSEMFKRILYEKQSKQYFLDRGL